MNIIHYLSNQNWFILAPAIVGYLNIIIAGSRAMGWSRISDECTKIENAIQAMVATALGKKIASMIILCFLLSVPSYAQTGTTTTTVSQPSITSILDGLTLDVGTGWDIKNSVMVETDTVRFLEYAKTDNSGKYAAFLNFAGQVDPRFSIGYSSSDKAVVGVAFNLIEPKMIGITSPLLEFISISPFAQYSFYHIGSNLSNIKDSWIFGAYFIKAKV